MNKNNQLEIISKNLAPTAEYWLQSNVEMPIEIHGVAKMKIRDSKQDPWREGFVVCYEHWNIKKQAEINKELYDALNLIFHTLSDIEDVSFDFNGAYSFEKKEKDPILPGT